MTHKVISTSNQSVAKQLTWFTGTKEECERHLPAIKYLFKNTSDEFEIIEYKQA